MRDGTMTIERECEYAPWPTATSALRAAGAAVFVRAGLPRGDDTTWRRRPTAAMMVPDNGDEIQGWGSVPSPRHNSARHAPQSGT